MKMKIFISFLFVLVVHSSIAQRTQKPTIFINGKEANLYSPEYIKPNNIDSMIVDRTTENGSIYIYTKDNIKLLSLNEIVEKYTNLTEIDNTILFQINGDIVNDTLNIKIDASWYIYVEVKDLAKANYLDKTLNQLKIVSIDLEKEERIPQIWIRGENS